MSTNPRRAAAGGETPPGSPARAGSSVERKDRPRHTLNHVPSALAAVVAGEVRIPGEGDHPFQSEGDHRFRSKATTDSSLKATTLGWRAGMVVAIPGTPVAIPGMVVAIPGMPVAIRRKL